MPRNSTGSTTRRWTPRRSRLERLWQGNYEDVALDCKKRQHQPKGDDADVPWAECARRLRASRAEADQLRERVAQLERAPRPRSSSRSVKGRAGWCAGRRERAAAAGALGTKCFGGRPRRGAPRRCGIGGRAEDYGGFTEGFSGIARRVPAVAESKDLSREAPPPPPPQRKASVPRQRRASSKVRQAHAAAAALSGAAGRRRRARGARGRRLVRAARPLRPDAVPARPRGAAGGARGAPRRLGQPLAVVRLFERRLAAVRAVLRVAPVHLFQGLAGVGPAAAAAQGPRAETVGVGPPRPAAAAAPSSKRAVPRRTGGARRGRGGARGGRPRRGVAVAAPGARGGGCRRPSGGRAAGARAARRTAATRGAGRPSHAAARRLRPHRAPPAAPQPEPAQPEPAAPRRRRRAPPSAAPCRRRPPRQNRSRRAAAARAAACTTGERAARVVPRGGRRRALAVPPPKRPRSGRSAAQVACTESPLRDRNAENAKTDDVCDIDKRLNLQALREAKSAPLIPRATRPSPTAA